MFFFKVFFFFFLEAGGGSFPGGASGKEPTRQCSRRKRHGFDPRVIKIPWRREWQPTPVFLPGESHGRRSLAGYGPWGHNELDTTEATLHIYFWLHWTFTAITGFSLVSASRGYSLAAVLGFLTAVASLVVEHGL